MEKRKPFKITHIDVKIQLNIRIEHWQTVLGSNYDTFLNV